MARDDDCARHPVQSQTHRLRRWCVVSPSSEGRGRVTYNVRDTALFTPPRWCTDLSCCGMCVADGALQALLFGDDSRRPMSSQACRPPRQDAWLIPDPLLPYVPPALRLRSSCVASNSPLPPSNPCGLRVDLRGQVACGCRATAD